MDRKSLSITELEDILQKIKTVLTEAGLPKGSVEIKLKRTDELDIESLTSKLTEQSPEWGWKWGSCDGGFGICIDF